MHEQPLSLGFYFHVPFCASSCDFCAFYREAPLRRDLERYLEGMEREIARWAGVRPPVTVFWGGGTPGLLPPKDLYRLGRAFLDTVGKAPAEWSVEMAPSTVKPEKLATLRALGVTRISMGVQSFQPDLLEAIGRRHSPKQIREAVAMIRGAGFANLNLDLIIACPGQSLYLLRRDIEEALALEPEHISAYCLTFEDDTALYAKLMRGQVRQQTEDEEAALYESAWRQLEEAGLRQYEISNFARPGFECTHNLNTWRMHEWIGVGPSASSQYGGRRFTNAHDMEAWLKGLECGRPSFVDEEELTAHTLACDSLIFGLRMNEGVDLDALSRRFPAADLAPVFAFLATLADEGLAESDGPVHRLTLNGRLLADSVGAELMGLF